MSEVNGEEVQVITIVLPSGEKIEQCFIREFSSGLLFSVDASFVEQDVDVIRSPYGNGNIYLSE